MGNRIGSLKARQKMIEFYGSEEAYRAEMRRRAAKGGKKPTGAFKDRNLASRAGKISQINQKKNKGLL